VSELRIVVERRSCGSRRVSDRGIGVAGRKLCIQSWIGIVESGRNRASLPKCGDWDYWMRELVEHQVDDYARYAHVEPDWQRPAGDAAMFVEAGT
jgi:hypothetical protein